MQASCGRFTANYMDLVDRYGASSTGARNPPVARAPDTRNQTPPQRERGSNIVRFQPGARALPEQALEATGSSLRSDHTSTHCQCLLFGHLSDRPIYPLSSLLITLYGESRFCPCTYWSHLPIGNAAVVRAQGEEAHTWIRWHFPFLPERC